MIQHLKDFVLGFIDNVVYFCKNILFYTAVLVVFLLTMVLLSAPLIGIYYLIGLSIGMQYAGIVIAWVGMLLLVGFDGAAKRRAKRARLNE